MSIRITRKGIIILVVLLVLIAAGVGGYLAWKVNNDANLGNTDSSAANGCSTKSKQDCSGCGGVKADGKSYQCKWYSASNSCKESSQECTGGGGGTECDGQSIGGQMKCNIGAKECQKANGGGNTGYNCTCIDLSSGGVCITDWQCNTLDTNACPVENYVSPTNFACVSISGGCATLDGATDFDYYTCPGMEDGSGGCQENGVKKSGNKACPSVSADFCGWIQADFDYANTGCFASWHIPCTTPTPTPTPTPGVCQSTCGTGCPSGLTCTGGKCINPSCPNDADCTCGTLACNSTCTTNAECASVSSNYQCITGKCRDISCPTATNCQCNSAWTINKTAAVMCINENTPQVASKVTYMVSITYNSNGQTGTIGSIQDTFTASPVTVPAAWISGIDNGGVVSTGTTGAIVTWTLTGAAQNFIGGQTRTFSFVMTVPGAPYNVQTDFSPQFGTYSNNVTADVLTPDTTKDLNVSRTILVGCQVPSTGLFDSTYSKIILALLLLVVGILYFTVDQFENLVLNVIGGGINTVKSINKSIKHATSSKTFEAKQIKKVRKEFEQRTVDRD